MFTFLAILGGLVALGALAYESGSRLAQVETDALRGEIDQQRRTIGASSYLYAELPWAIRHECPATLSDVLERRVRLALFAQGQGLPQLAELARVAGEAAGWDAERTRAEAAAYAASVRRQYQIVSRAEAERAA